MLILLPHHVGVTTVAARKKIGAERCESVFDAHPSKASKELKVVQLRPPLARKGKDDWRIFLQITLGFSHR